MAEAQRAGTPFTVEQMEFINQVVQLELGCGDVISADGWYADLFFYPVRGAEFDPTIADVHTQPTDEVGSPVGRVLHVATGKPRLIVTTFETCTGPRAYAGVVSSYFEDVTEQFERRTDEDWVEELYRDTPADVWWMEDLVVR